jgi:autotransporter-associated beta strand protein
MMKTWRGVGCGLAVCAALSANAVQTAGDLLIRLDAAELSVDNNAAISVWPNAGTLGGDFKPANANRGPIFESSVAGVPAASFRQSADHVLTNMVPIPASITGETPVYSFEAWVYNPYIAQNEIFFTWTVRDVWPDNLATGSCVEYRYGVDNNTVEHNSANIAWGDGQHAPGTPPAAGAWHHYCHTRDASGRERLYVDGVLRTYNIPAVMRVRTDGFFTLGSVRHATTPTTWSAPFGGSIARLRVHSGTLSPAAVVANYLDERDAFGVTSAPDRLWSGPAGGAWETAANWSGASLPGPADRVSINEGAPVLLSASAIGRLFAFNGALTVDGGAALTVLPEINGSTYVGLWSNNVFNLTLKHGSVTSLDGTNGASVYLGQSGAQFIGTIGDGTGPAVFDAGRDLIIGGGTGTPRSFARVTVGPGGELFSSNGWIYVGIDTADTKLTVNGGTVGTRLQDKDLRIGRNSASGVVELNSGLIAVGQDLYLTPDATAAANGELILNGGVVQARRFLGGTAAATNRVCLNGGVIRNRDTRTDFFQSVDVALVQPGGVGFDILANTTATVAQPLLSDPDLGDGGITKTGPGTLTLTGANTVTGAVSVLEGLLLLNNAAVLPADYAAPITVAAGASIGYAKSGALAWLLKRIAPASEGSLLVTDANAAEDIDLSAFPNLHVSIQTGVTYTGTLTPYSGVYYRFAPAAAERFTQTVAGPATLTLSPAATLGSLELTVAGGFTETTVDGSMLILNHPGALGNPAPASAPDIGLYNGGQLVLRHADISAASIVARIKPDSRGYFVLGNAAHTNLAVDLSALPGVTLGTDQQTLNYTAAVTPKSGEYRLGGGRVPYNTGGYNGLTVANLADGAGEPRKLVVEGYGLVRANAGNTYSGGTLVTNAGALFLAADAGLGAVPASVDPANLTIDGGALRVGNAAFTLNANRGITVGPGGMAVHPWSSATLTLAGGLHGTGAITNTDSGVIILGGSANDWSGTLTLLSGTYLVGSGSTFSWNPNARVNGKGASFGVSYDGDLAWSTAFGEPLGSVSDVVTGFPLNNLNLRKEGTGVLTLDVPQSYTGTTDIRRGTLRVGSPGHPIPSGYAKGNVALTYANALSYGVLDLNGFDTPVNALTGAGFITNSSAAPAVLSIGINNAAGTFTGVSDVPIEKVGGTVTAGIATFNAPAEIRGDVSVRTGLLMLGPAATLRANLDIVAPGTVQVANELATVSGLTGDYYNFSDAALRTLCDATNFVPLILNGKLAAYRPSFTANSAVSSNVFVFNPNFPAGVPADFFVARYTGDFFAEAEGDYTFATASDDGNFVFIDGTLVVSNAFEQSYSEAAKRSGTVALAQGWHEIEIDYFEKSGGNVLAVWLTPPGGEPQFLPQSLLRPRPTALGTLTGAESSTLSLTAPSASLAFDSEDSAVFNGTLVAQSVTNRLIKAGAGTQTLRRVNFPGVAEVASGALALQPSPLVGSAEPAFASAVLRPEGALAIRAVDPAWPSGGLLGAYHRIANFNSGIHGATGTLFSTYNNRVPDAVYPTTSAGVTFTYDPSTTFPPPYGTGFENDFQVLWQGRLVAREAGQYIFSLASDDRSDLYVDGVLIATNANSGATRVGTNSLAAGTHDVLLPFQQGTGGYRFALSWTTPGGTALSAIPNAALRPGGALVRALGTQPGASVSLPDPASFLRLDLEEDTVAAAAFSGAAGSEIEKAGPSRLTLIADNDAYHGGWFVPSGELRVGDGGTNGTLGGASVYVSSGATLAFDRSDDIAVTALLAGFGSVVSLGTGKVTLSGDLSGFNGTLAAGEDSRVALAENAVLPVSQFDGTGSVTVEEGGGLYFAPDVDAFAAPVSSSNGVLVVAVTNDASAWHLSELTLAAGTTLAVAPSGLWGRYYDIPGQAATALAFSNAFNSVEAAEAFFAGYSVQLKANSHEAGTGFDFGDSTKNTIRFPGVYASARNYYGVIWRGKIRITAAGPYTFSTTSDDHSMLFIDGLPVVDNNGNHSYVTKSGTVALDPGLHDIVILYAQITGGYGIRADVLMPGATAAIPLPNAMLVADTEDTPAYTLTVDKVNIVGASGAGTVAMGGNGVLRFGALSVDIGTRFAVTGAVALSAPMLSVTVTSPVPYGIMVVGDFSQTGGLDLSGRSLRLLGSEGNLRYVAESRVLQIGRSSGMMILLR